jgi:hypothetical protein
MVHDTILARSDYSAGCFGARQGHKEHTRIGFCCRSGQQVVWQDELSVLLLCNDSLYAKANRRLDRRSSKQSHDLLDLLMKHFASLQACHNRTRLSQLRLDTLVNIETI